MPDKIQKLKNNFYCYKCNKTIVNLYRHLKTDHKMTVDDYLKWLLNSFDHEWKVLRNKKGDTK